MLKPNPRGYAPPIALQRASLPLVCDAETLLIDLNALVFFGEGGEEVLKQAATDTRYAIECSRDILCIQDATCIIGVEAQASKSSPLSCLYLGKILIDKSYNLWESLFKRRSTGHRCSLCIDGLVCSIA